MERERFGPETLDDPDYEQAQRLLEQEYRKVWVSEPEGLLEVWRHR